MNWLWRMIIIIPISEKNKAENFIRSINSTGPDYTGDAFNIFLSVDGNNPPSHCVLMTPATDNMFHQIKAFVDHNNNIMYWQKNTDDILISSNMTQPSEQIWTIDDSIKLTNLKIIHNI